MFFAACEKKEQIVPASALHISWMLALPKPFWLDCSISKFSKFELFF